MKYFAVSDIHGFYDELIAALEKAGFDKDNPDHTLVVCGDLFDRGEKPIEVMEFVESLERVELIYGNHEELLEEALQRNKIYPYDVQNGTADTIHKLLEYYGEKVDGYWIKTPIKIKHFFSKFRNYFETEHYIFVHSWIPAGGLAYLEDWREPTSDWEMARWANPFQLALVGANETGKTIVFGHWHCSAGWALQFGASLGVPEWGEESVWEPYYNEEQHIIAIDRCTAYTGEVNVVVIED